MKKLIRGLLATLLATAALYPMNTMAQDPSSLKMPTLEDLIPGGETYRYTENLYELQWWGDQCIKPEIDSLFALNPKNGRETLLATREAVNRALEQAGVPKLSHFYNVRTPWTDRTEMLLPVSQKYAVYNWETGQVTTRDDLPKEPAANYDLNTESLNLAYTVKNNLYVNGKQVTNEPEGIVCGQSVHRNEFGISKGTFWSPKGTLLAFYRMNESMVTPYPLVDITQRIAILDRIRYPMAGMLSHKVKVGIYNPATDKVVYLDAGDPKNRYFTNISWAPDERSLFLIELNRDQNHAKLCQYDAQTGKLMQVLIEGRSNPSSSCPGIATSSSTRASVTAITTSTCTTWNGSTPSNPRNSRRRRQRNCGTLSRRLERERLPRESQVYNSPPAPGSCRASSASTPRRRKSSLPPPRSRPCKAIYIRCASRTASWPWWTTVRVCTTYSSPPRVRM